MAEKTVAADSRKVQGGGRPSVWTILARFVIGAAAIGVVVVVLLDLGKSPQGVKGTRYEYSLDDHVSKGSDLLGYILVREVPVDLPNPRGLSVAADGKVYVGGDRLLVVTDLEGKELSRFSLPGQVRCVAAADEGVVFVGMTDHVEFLDTASGTLIAWPWMGERAVITSIAVAPSTVFIADSGNRLVYRFDRTGKLISIIGSDKKPGRRPAFIIPSAYFDLALDRDGGLWIADTGRHSIGLYSDEGDLLRSWGKYAMDIDGFSGCCNPVHFAILPGGSFVTSEKGIKRVKVYSSEGSLESVVAVPRDFQWSKDGLDLAVAPDGDVVILIPGLDVFRVYTEA